MLTKEQLLDLGVLPKLEEITLDLLQELYDVELINRTYTYILRQHKQVDTVAIKIRFFEESMPHLLGIQKIPPRDIKFRNISPVLEYGVERGYIPNKLSFKQLKEEEKIKEIYTPEELALLLKKPNVKKCSFAEFRNWVTINFLLGTGVRARELRNIKVKDIDLDNDLIALQVTKNRKARYISIPRPLNKVLSEYLPLRQVNSDEDYLFCAQYGEMMPRTTLQMLMKREKSM